MGLRGVDRVSLRDKMNFLNVFEQYKYDQTIVAKSRVWFQQQALLLRKQGVTTNKVYKNSGRVVSKIQPGNLYMFFYDPKYKETLPHYDRFPLVFPFEKTENGFLGLNMHYLSYKLRIGVLENLMRFKTTKGIEEKTRLRYSYSMLQGIAKFGLAKHCVKHYLSEHIVTQLKIIEPADWTTAMMLPVESFAKATTTQVWKTTGGT
jgi:hypothetical protein